MHLTMVVYQSAYGITLSVRSSEIIVIIRVSAGRVLHVRSVRVVRLDPMRDD